MSARDDAVDAFAVEHNNPCTRHLAEAEMAGYLDAYRAEVLREAADAVLSEAWPHERDERENELIYSLSDRLSRMAEETP
jgi:hypothetical protein